MDPLNRPTHIGLELRLTLPEAETLTAFLIKFRDLVRSRVMTVPGDRAEELEQAMGKLLDRLRESSPPFDEAEARPPPAGSKFSAPRPRPSRPPSRPRSAPATASPAPPG